MTTDLTRYPVGNDEAGRLALWCADCEVVGGIDDASSPIEDSPIWTEDDNPDQVTELVLANLVAVAELHETERHADSTDTALGRLCAAAEKANTGAGLLAMQIVKRATDQMREYDEHGSRTVNVRQVLGLLSPTWPDGNYTSSPTDGAA
jgi:hypothetical protein